MPFEIIRNDIVNVQADAIVNTANPEPIVGAGTDTAIHKAAGPELLEERKKLGRIAVGQSAPTPAFRLEARYVLHTVSPVWIDGRHGEEEGLRQAYDSALSLALRLGCESVAFPLMSAGSYGFPKDLALSVAIRAFTDFLMEHEMRIFLVVFNRRAFGIAESIFDDLKSYIDDNYVRERNAEEYVGPGFAAPTSAGVHSKLDEYQRQRRRRNEAARRERDRRERERREQKLMDADLAWEDSDVCAAREAPDASPAPPLAMSHSARASLSRFLEQHEKTFSEYLLDLLRERNGKDSEVYKRAEVSKQLFSKILNNREYQPSKTTVIQLAIGLELDLPQTQKLLEKAGYALTRSSKADLVVQYYIERQVYSVSFINEALLDCGLPLLKTGLKA